MNDKLFNADSTQFNRSLGEGFHTVVAESRAPKTDKGQIFVRAFIGRFFLSFLNRPPNFETEKLVAT